MIRTHVSIGAAHRTRLTYLIIKAYAYDFTLPVRQWSWRNAFLKINMPRKPQREVACRWGEALEIKRRLRRFVWILAETDVLRSGQCRSRWLRCRRVEFDVRRRARHWINVIDRYLASYRLRNCGKRCDDNVFAWTHKVKRNTLKYTSTSGYQYHKREK